MTTSTFHFLLRPLTSLTWVRYGTHGLVLILTAATIPLYQDNQKAAQTDADALTTQTAALSKLQEATIQFATLRSSVEAATDKGIDTTSTQAEFPIIRTLLSQGNYAEAQTKIVSLQEMVTNSLAGKEASDLAVQQAAEEAEKQKGTVTGTIQANGQPVVDARMSLIQNNATVQSVQTDSAGAYSFRTAAGTYIVKVEKNGFVNQEKEIAIPATQEVSWNVTLVAPTPTPTPTAKPTATPKPPTPTPSATTTPPSSDSTAYSNYYTTNLSSSRASHSAYIMSFELGSGKIKVVTDTASDSDCSNNCPTLSIKGYVDRHNGLAGVNGTYFCPSDYSSCSNEVNSFFWKIHNSRNGVMINQYNTLGENDPFLTFDSVGNPKLYSSWNSYMRSGTTAYAGINHKPLLVNGGNNVLNEESLDSKQKSDRITRAALAVKGSTLYVVSINSATVPDLASALDGMDIDYALNIDAGGSRGWYYNGGYKLGPGRSVPNALIFVQQ